MTQLPSNRTIIVVLHLFFIGCLVGIFGFFGGVSGESTLAYTYTAADRHVSMGVESNQGDGVLWLNSSQNATAGQTNQHLVTVNNSITPTQNVTIELSTDISNWHLTASGDNSRTVQLGSGVTEGFYVDIGSNAATGEARYYIRSTDGTFWFNQTRTINVSDNSTTSESTSTPPYVYSGNASGGLHKHYVANGTRIWQYTNFTDTGTGGDGGVTGIDVAADGYIYATGVGLHKIAPNGTQVWNITGDTANSNPMDEVAIGPDGYVYSAQGRDVVKFTPDGTEVWTVTNDRLVKDIAVSAEGNVYIGRATGSQSDKATLIKRGADGEKHWALTGTAGRQGVSIGPNGYVYSVQNTTGSLLKRHPGDGALIENKSLPNQPLSESDSPVGVLATNSAVYVDVYSSRYGHEYLHKYYISNFSRDWSSAGNRSDYAAVNDGSVISGGDATSFWRHNGTGSAHTVFKYENHTTTVTATGSATDFRGPFAKPIAGFDSTPQSPDPGETITFNASETTDNGSITSYEWDFNDDGSTDATGETVTHTFETEGDYPVTLTVTDGDSNTDTVTQTIPVQTIQYVYTLNTSGGLHKHYAGNKTQIWTYNNLSDGNEVAVGPNGAVYVTAGKYGMHKLASNGTFVWQYNHSTKTLYSVAVSGTGGIYLDAGGDLIRLYPNGTHHYTDGISQSVSVSDIQGLGNSVVATAVTTSDFGGATLVRYNKSGQMWKDKTVNSREGVGVDDSGNIYATIGQRLQKYNASGGQQWERDLNAQLEEVAVDNGSIYTQIALTNVSRVTTDGTHQWNYTGHTKEIAGLTALPNGDVVTAGQDNTSRRVTTTNTVSWNYTRHSETVVDVAGPFSLDAANQPPTANFTYTPTAPTTNDTVTFNASRSTDPDGNITTYEWDFGGDGTVDTTGEVVTHTYNASGNYTVTLTVTDNGGTTDTTTRTVTVTGNERPTVEFDHVPIHPRPDDEVLFNASDSVDSDGTIVEYAWDFDDDGVVNTYGEIENYTWSSTGTYNVTLTIEDDDGATASTTTTIDVVEDPQPTAKTVFIGNADGLLMRYPGNGSQKDKNASVVNYPGPLFTGPNHVYYISSNAYKAEFNGSTDWEYASNSSMTGLAGDLPNNSVFAVTYEGAAIKLFQNGTVDWNKTGYASNYEAAAVGPSGALYAGSGNGYLLRLHPDGTKDWNISVRPSAAYGVVTDPNGGIYVRGDGNVSKYNTTGAHQWTYTNGSARRLAIANGNLYIGTSNSYLHNVSLSGTQRWNVSLDVGKAQSLTIGPSDDIYYLGRYNVTRLSPNATTERWNKSTNTPMGIALRTTDGDPAYQPYSEFDYTPAYPDTGNTTTFDASESYDPDGTITSYEWDLDGDGTVDATGETLNHTYNAAGNYSVTLTVTDNESRTTTETEWVNVSGNEGPTANFTYTPSEPVENESIQFNGSSSTDSDGTIQSYEWDFTNDGTVDATGEVVNHTFTTAGDYNVSLTVTDNDSATATRVRTVTVAVPCTKTTYSDLLIDDFEDGELCEYMGDMTNFTITSHPTVSGSRALHINNSDGKAHHQGNITSNQTPYVITRGDRATFTYQLNNTARVAFGFGGGYRIGTKHSTDSIYLDTPNTSTSKSVALPENTQLTVSVKFARNGSINGTVFQPDGSQLVTISTIHRTGRTGNISVRYIGNSTGIVDNVHIRHRVIDDVEDSNLDEYTKSGAYTIGSTAYHGSASFYFDSKKSSGTLYANDTAAYPLDYYPNSNETTEFYCQTEKGGGSVQRNCRFIFARNNSAGTQYTAQITTANDTLSLFKTDSTGTRSVLAETTTSSTIGTGTWYRGRVTYAANGSIRFSATDMSTNTKLGDLSVTDTAYSDGVIGVGGKKAFVDYIRIVNRTGTATSSP